MNIEPCNLNRNSLRGNANRLKNEKRLLFIQNIILIYFMGK